MAQINIPTERYPSNSHKAKEQKEMAARGDPKPSRIVNTVGDSKPTMKKRKLSARMKGLVNESKIKEVSTKAVDEVFIPQFMTSLYDFGCRILSALIFKDQNPRRPADPFASRYMGGPGYYNYNQMYNPLAQQQTIKPTVQAKTTNDMFHVSDLIFPAFNEADYVLKDMQNVIQTYGHVTVDYVLSLVGRSRDIPVTAHDFGWVNLDQAYINTLAEGYHLVLPQAVNIK